MLTAINERLYHTNSENNLANIRHLEDVHAKFVFILTSHTIQDKCHITSACVLQVIYQIDKEKC